MAKSKKTFVKKEVSVLPPEPIKTSRFKLGKRGILILIILIIVLVVAGSALYIYYQNNGSITPQTDVQKLESQNKSLLENVGKLIVLPDEKPQIATVTDVAKLLDQPFFAKAKNGDKVLIYNVAAKVILYRPSIGKLIDVAPLNTSTAPANQNTPTPQATLSPATAVVLNGTLTSGLAKSAQTKINESPNSVTVSKVGDTVSGNYDQTIVVDVSGKHKTQAESLAKLLGGKIVTSVPDGENTPSSDILVILGANYTK